jgi:hypothetical protein
MSNYYNPGYYNILGIYLTNLMRSDQVRNIINLKNKIMEFFRPLKRFFRNLLVPSHQQLKDIIEGYLFDSYMDSKASFQMEDFWSHVLMCWPHQYSAVKAAMETDFEKLKEKGMIEISEDGRAKLL